jgi:hypothetical protein
VEVGTTCREYPCSSPVKLPEDILRQVCKTEDKDDCESICCTAPCTPRKFTCREYKDFRKVLGDSEVCGAEREIGTKGTCYDPKDICHGDNETSEERNRDCIDKCCTVKVGIKCSEYKCSSPIPLSPDTLQQVCKATEEEDDCESICCTVQQKCGDEDVICMKGIKRPLEEIRDVTCVMDSMSSAEETSLEKSCQELCCEIKMCKDSHWKDVSVEPLIPGGGGFRELVESECPCGPVNDFDTKACRDDCSSVDCCIPEEDCPSDFNDDGVDIRRTFETRRSVNQIPLQPLPIDDDLRSNEEKNGPPLTPAAGGNFVPAVNSEI